MIDKSELKKLAYARLKDSKILCSEERYDGAVYICGYVIEVDLDFLPMRIEKWMRTDEIFMTGLVPGHTGA